MEEKWEDVVVDGVAWPYKVSNLGRIKNKVGKILRNWSRRDGYVEIHLYLEGNRQKFYIHRLVALHFVPNDEPDRMLQVDHINHMRDDNRATNLQWASYSENQSRRRDRLTMKGSPKKTVTITVEIT